MPRIEIQKLGPIEECAFDINNFTVLTGAQASGKSTIAKTIFFARTVKDDLNDLIVRRTFLESGEDSNIYNDLLQILRNKFTQLFGALRTLDDHASLVYFYSDETFIKVTVYVRRDVFKSDHGREEVIVIRDLRISMSSDIVKFARSSFGKLEFNSKLLRKELDDLFHDDCQTVFIPAGRSLITLLTSQLNYLFTTMDDDQKRSIDFCTQKYIERILRIRPLFENGIDGLIRQKKDTPGVRIDEESIARMLRLINEVLKGKYIYSNNEERLYIDEKQFIKINYTSSGQQEVVWIFNILLHLMINNTKAFIILEEPEAHLYPEAQNKMVEILALISNKGCGVLLTTHSPYILGAMNNLIYAGKLSEHGEWKSQVSALVENTFYIRDYHAWFLERGRIHSCIETQENGGLIINEVIDGASSEINELYDRLFDIEYGRIGRDGS